MRIGPKTTKLNSAKISSLKVVDIKDHLLFIHAWSGCDTVSEPFGKGKTGLLQQFLKSEELKQISTCMTDVWATVEEIGNRSIDVFRIMCNGRKEDTLTSLK